MDADRVNEMKLRSLRMRLKGYRASPEADPAHVARMEQEIEELEMPQKVYWTSPLPATGCQLTNRPFNEVMYDANLPGIGWGNWCQETFDEYRGRLGTGLGQKYVLQDDGRWLKVEG